MTEVHWTLGAKLEEDCLDLWLSDGRRLAVRARNRLPHGFAGIDPSAVALLGTEVVSRLSQSAPRALSLQYEGDLLDAIDWERLVVGGERLAQRFALGRLPLSEEAAEPMAAPPLADTLEVVAVCGRLESSWHDIATTMLPALLTGASASAAQSAHVLILDCVDLRQLLSLWKPPVGRRLLIATAPEAVSTRTLASALDAGMAIALVPDIGDPPSEVARQLVWHLRQGECVGEAMRRVQRRPDWCGLGLRLYGEPELRFTHRPAPTIRRQVTSLSFDLVGSTALMASLGDEAYADTLASVHSRCAQIVKRLGGQSDDPKGNDGAMAYFGHPVAQEDAAVHAVRAGLEIARTAAELRLGVRLGVATGWVAIKGDHPVGMSIHLAARLQQAADQGSVLVSDSTARLVRHAFELRELADPPRLKGIESAGVVHLVLGAHSEMGPYRLESVAGLTPLLARRIELDQLHQCWGALARDQCLIALVKGEVGIGKTRLVREFRHQLTIAGARVLECRCRADAAASPFFTLAEALRRWLDIGLQEAPSEAWAKLTTAVPAALSGGEELALLGEFLGLPSQSSGPAQQEDHARRRVLDCLVKWFQGIAGGQPCCLVIEDWHWVDPSLAELVEHMVQHPKGPGLMVLLTLRSEAVARRTPTPIRCGIELGPLPPEESCRLIEAACADVALSPRLVSLLALRGDGVPLFLEEAARLAIELANPAHRLSDTLALSLVPSSLQDLLSARLDALGSAKALAQVAAVLGRQFSFQMLTALLDATGTPTRAEAQSDAMTKLVDSGLVRAEKGGWYAFRHALIRDAAYASLWVRDRQALHAKVVGLLRDRWPEWVAQQPELLALHLGEAGLHEQALAQWELAASRAAGRSAEVEAISHLEQALAQLPQTPAGVVRDRTALRLQLLLAARLLTTEGYGADTVLAAYLEAQRLCQALGDDAAQVKVEMGLHAYHFMRADFTQALAHAQRAAVLAGDRGSVKQRLQAHWAVACTLFHQGALRASMREMDAALALYTPQLHSHFGAQDPGVMCMAYSAWGLWESGRPDAALRRAEQGVAVAHEVQHRFSHAVALAYAVSVELLRGDTGAALARAERCVQVCEEYAFPVWLAITRCMRGYLWCEQGQFSAGLSEMKAGHTLWLSTGSRVSQPLYLALQAEGLMLAGDLVSAQGQVDEGLAIVESLGERQLEAELHRLRGELALLRGDVAGGEASLVRALKLALRQRRLGFALRSATALATHWASEGRQARAVRLLEPLAGRWQEGLDTRDLRRAAACIDLLKSDPQHRGRHDEQEATACR